MGVGDLGLRDAAPSTVQQVWPALHPSWSLGAARTAGHRGAGDVSPRGASLISMSASRSPRPTSTAQITERHVRMIRTVSFDELPGWDAETSFLTPSASKAPARRTLLPAAIAGHASRSAGTPASTVRRIRRPNSADRALTGQRAENQQAASLDSATPEEGEQSHDHPNDVFRSRFCPAEPMSATTEP